MRRKIIRVGSSRGVLLPREVTRAMNWSFGTEVELSINRETKEITLKTIKTKIPDDFNAEYLHELEDLVNQDFKLISDIND